MDGMLLCQICSIKTEPGSTRTHFCSCEGFTEVTRYFTNNHCQRGQSSQKQMTGRCGGGGNGGVGERMRK